MSLRQDSPAKYEVAKRLHSTTPEGSVASKDALGRQSTPLLATCFGNRSAALYELGQTEVPSLYHRAALKHVFAHLWMYVLHNTMQECLIDIERAIHHGYVITSPEDKLIRRREKCLTQRQRQNRSSVASNRAEDLSNPKLFNAFESEHVTVKSHHNCGRYIEVEQYLLYSLSCNIHHHCKFYHTHCRQFMTFNPEMLCSQRSRMQPFLIASLCTVTAASVSSNPSPLFR